MKKLKLELDTLEIASFDAGPAEPKIATVRGHDSTGYTYTDYFRSCVTCVTCYGMTCP